MICVLVMMAEGGNFDLPQERKSCQLLRNEKSPSQPFILDKMSTVSIGGNSGANYKGADDKAQSQ